METLEQEKTTLDNTRAANDNEASFSSTLKKAIDLCSNSSNEENTDEATTDKFFYYSVGSNKFLIEQDLKAETLKEIPVNQIPFTPEWYLGLVNIRGVIMPVIDIHTFVTSQTQTTKKTNEKVTNYHNESYFLKLEHKAHKPIVIKIDKLPEQININKLKKRKTAKTQPNWMLHTIQNGTSSVTEVDHQVLFNQIKALS